ncbi:hypothetical protein [Streptomyces sp. NPDC048392]|uniref:hypothetical protein n=1 Tax=Streptomyces sp. NPDC048392 TaxID=3365543 RepID=UPI00371841DD
MSTQATEVHKTTSREVGRPTTPLVRKYTTHLPPEMVKWIKIEAVEREVKDYQIVEEAIRALQFKAALSR